MQQGSEISCAELRVSVLFEIRIKLSTKYGTVPWSTKTRAWFQDLCALMAVAFTLYLSN